MIPAPTVAGLHVCHDVQIDMDRHEITLTRIFRNLVSRTDGTQTSPFWAFAIIAGPLGRGNLRLRIMDLDLETLVYEFQHPIDFRDRLSPVYLKLNLQHCRSTREGGYEIMLRVDDDIIAQRVFVVSKEGA